MSETLKRVIHFTSQIFQQQLTNEHIKELAALIAQTKHAQNPSPWFIAEIALKFRERYQPLKQLAYKPDIHQELNALLHENIIPGEISVPSTKHTNRNRNSTVNTNISHFLGVQNLKQLAGALNPASSYRTAYLTLDSRYATFSENNTKLSWNYINTLSSTTDSAVNSTQLIGNCVAMRMHSVVIPKFVPNTYGRASILVEEFASQAFIAPNGRRFHCLALLNDLLDPVTIVTRITATAGVGYTPDAPTWDKYELLMGYRFNDGIYTFEKPITVLDSFTLSFGNPFTLLNIPKYAYKLCTFTSINWGANAFVIEFPEPHYMPAYRPNAQWEDLIFSLKITDLTSTDPVTDASFITYMTTNEFTSAEKTTDTSITVSFRNIRPPGAHNVTITYNAVLSTQPTSFSGTPSPFTVIFETNRFISSMELTYIAAD